MLWKTFITLALLTGLYGNAQAVIIGDKEWRQLTETTNFSYNDLTGTSGPCSATTGECSGELDGVDFTGWTWATVGEVGTLFEIITSSLVGTFSSPATVSQSDSLWAPNSIDIDGSIVTDSGLFDATYINPQWNSQLLGITRTLTATTSSWVYLGRIIDQYSGPPAVDIATTLETQDVGRPSGSVGVWLYRDAQVPEPTTLVLMGIGLAGIGFSRKKKAS